MVSRTEIFDYIYRSRVWGDGFQSPLSGPGSIPENAEPYVQFVKSVIFDFQVSNVVDLGHGDWSMWRDYGFESIDYQGIEVSTEAHRIAKLRYERDHRTFVLEDILETRRPLDCDLLISKDCLQHLPNSDVIQILRLAQSARYLILCNDVHVPFDSLASAIRHHVRLRTRMRSLLHGQNPFQLWPRKNNIDTNVGGFRGLDFQASPFDSVLTTFNLVECWDFDAPKRHGVTKRVYFFCKR